MRTETRKKTVRIYGEFGPGTEYVYVNTVHIYSGSEEHNALGVLFGRIYSTVQAHIERVITFALKDIIARQEAYDVEFDKYVTDLDKYQHLPWWKKIVSRKPIEPQMHIVQSDSIQTFVDLNEWLSVELPQFEKILVQNGEFPSLFYFEDNNNFVGKMKTLIEEN